MSNPLRLTEEQEAGAHFRRNRFRIVGDLQKAGATAEDARRACDLAMAYNDVRGELDYSR